MVTLDFGVHTGAHDGSSPFHVWTHCGPIPMVGWGLGALGGVRVASFGSASVVVPDRLDGRLEHSMPGPLNSVPFLGGLLWFCGEDAWYGALGGITFEAAIALDM